ncbi:DUF6518 family protein [Agromyces aurantiacus]|uniref:DUF6518 family protein n=1 Tax=Agromyces aurantiacus TaxID=165814 RepID=A0ABV9R530_9MICO|nr:DUF6518 family protein [Agromyces aurantiacus]MBM7503768.1 hypothetical protein [Agromyces aurantiacus]
MTDSALVPVTSFRVPIAPSAARILFVAAIAFALGGLTSVGQTFLPEDAASLANSTAGWTAPTALLVFSTARSFREAIPAGVVSFVALTLGYAVVSTLRGFPFDPTTWAVIGVLAGPVIGAAAFALRRGRMAAAVGGGLLAGVLIGEGVYGLTVVAATTSPVFWWASIVLGGVLVFVVAARRLRDIRSTMVIISAAAVTAASFVGAYLALGALFAVL